ncbi:MAG TPA: cytochrome c oxidase subunit 3 [Acidobacteriota bacterium]|nr:cytochrome c oxidase subunit 3 [Acidobacteriota bacterium]
MATTILTPPETKPSIGGNGPGLTGNGHGEGDFGGGSHPDSFGPVRSAQIYRTGMWMGLAAVMMLFATFTSALVVRKGLSDDWRPLSLPRVMWVSTALLITSSLTLERSRRGISASHERSFVFWWYATTALGLAFLGGQWAAWRELISRGVYLASNPSSSFFYLLTAAHGLHLLGGICALLFVILRTRRHLLSRTAVDVCAIYWHCMDGLWVYLFILLSAGRWI